MKRPGITPEIIKDAALETAKNVPNIEESDIEGLAESIVDVYSHHDNGYEIAKALDENCYWCDIDPMFVEAMDSMSYNVNFFHKKACFKWVEDNDIKPPLEIGTMIKEGEITGICDHSPATYLVKLPDQDDEKGWSRRLIKFEDAVEEKP
jgi:hypothetical protein